MKKTNDRSLNATQSEDATQLTLPKAGLKIREPRALDEDIYLLDRGMRCLYGSYLQYKNLEYLMLTLSNTVTDKNSAREVLNFCANSQIAIFKTTECRLISHVTWRRLDPKIDKNPKLLTKTLMDCSAEFGNLKDLTKRLWNNFYNYSINSKSLYKNYRKSKSAKSQNDETTTDIEKNFYYPVIDLLSQLNLALNTGMTLYGGRTAKSLTRQLIEMAEKVEEIL